MYVRMYMHTFTKYKIHRQLDSFSLLSRIVHDNFDVWIGKNNTMMDPTKTDLQ